MSLKVNVIQLILMKGAQYIGEICRYLLSAPETPEEKEHSIEIMFGNGKIFYFYYILNKVRFKCTESFMYCMFLYL